jgi:tetratricopeptide (TPR) repeat protein
LSTVKASTDVEAFCFFRAFGIFFVAFELTTNYKSIFTMTCKSTLLITVCLMFFGVLNAQNGTECKTKLSFFHQPTKLEKYDEAYEPWLYVKNNCPDLNLAIYADGEKILKHKIKSSKGEDKKTFIEALISLWKDREEYFKSRTPIGEYAAKSCQLQYKYRDLLGKKTSELYQCFDHAFVTDSKTFKNPKSLYTYLHLAVNLYDEEEKSASDLFKTYDDIIEKIEFERKNYSEKLNALVLKSENGEKLTSKEKSKKNAYESYLKAYALIEDNIKAKIDIRANCENLIPLYTKEFETYKNDSGWLKRAVSRMYHKQCTEDKLYEKLVKQYDKVSPSTDTKVYVSTILLKKGKDQEAYNYLEEAYALETRPYLKSKLALKIGSIYEKKMQYPKARKYLLDAVKLNPSNGKPHLIIANMYSKSAKNCGKDNIYQRAVFWLAIKEVKKASKVDPTLKKLVNQYVANYEAKVPTKEEIFFHELAGKTIKINCWINRSIVVPDDD